MLRAYSLVDKSVDACVKNAEKSGRKPACSAGCSFCCRQPIPITPLEALAIMEYAGLKLPRKTKASCAEEWMRNKNLAPARRPCPLLLNGQCAAYGVRPLACRRYLVSGSKCRANEDPATGRYGDMLIPERDALNNALLSTFPWYEENYAKYGLIKAEGLTTDAARLEYLKNSTTFIQALPWQDIFAA